jgi:hypothetical protein
MNSEQFISLAKKSYDKAFDLLKTEEFKYNVDPLVLSSIILEFYILEKKLNKEEINGKIQNIVDSAKESIDLNDIEISLNPEYIEMFENGTDSDEFMDLINSCIEKLDIYDTDYYIKYKDKLISCLQKKLEDMYFGEELIEEEMNE